jgi:hypothetical protein
MPINFAVLAGVSRISNRISNKHQQINTAILPYLKQQFYIINAIFIETIRYQPAIIGHSLPCCRNHMFC